MRFRSTTRRPTISSSSGPRRWGSLHAALAIIDLVERNGTYVNTSPFGEPQLGRRGLYRSIGGGSSEEAAILWVLSLSDGAASLLDIATRASMPFDVVRGGGDALLDAGLLESSGDAQGQPGS